MAVTGVTANPQVVELGAGRYESLAYADDETFAPGDLIRISASGTIQMADVSGAGAVHGIALETGEDSSADAMPVFLFAPDTVVKIQCIDGVAPEDLTKGVAYTLDVTTGSQAITSTATSGVAMVVGYAGDAQPWADVTGAFDEDSSVNNNSVLVRFTAATLDTHAAAA